MKGQSAFWSNSFKLQGGTSKPTLLTDKEQVLNAEIIEAIHSVDSNQSFSASNGSGKRYKKSFYVKSQLTSRYKRPKWNIPSSLESLPMLRINWCMTFPTSLLFLSLMRQQQHKQKSSTMLILHTCLIDTRKLSPLIVGHCLSASVLLAIWKTTFMSSLGNWDSKHHTFYHWEWMAQT